MDHGVRGDAVPLASTVNFTEGRTVANSTLARLGPNGTVCIASVGTTDLIVDVADTSAMTWLMLIFEAAGNGCPQGHTVTHPAAAGDVTVKFNTAAVALTGIDARPPIWMLFTVSAPTIPPPACCPSTVTKAGAGVDHSHW